MMTRIQPSSFLRSCSAALCTLVVSVMVSGCADAPPANDADAQAEYDRANDPLEPWNRGVFDVNSSIDKAVIKPAAERYRDYVPEFVRDRVRDFLNNLRSPVIFANDLLQGDSKKAVETFTRFSFNTGFGLGGLFDVSSGLIARHDNDLGETLGVWGVGEGPYLVLPLLGPSNPRDAFGVAVESYADPFDRYASNMGYDYVTFVRAVFSGVNRRTENLDTLDEIERTSVDPYSTIRSLYRQYRQSVIDGKPTADKPRPGLSGEFPNDAELSQESN